MIPTGLKEPKQTNRDPPQSSHLTALKDFLTLPEDLVRLSCQLRMGLGQICFRRFMPSPFSLLHKFGTSLHCHPGQAIEHPLGESESRDANLVSCEASERPSRSFVSESCTRFYSHQKTWCLIPEPTTRNGECPRYVCSFQMPKREKADIFSLISKDTDICIKPRQRQTSAYGVQTLGATGTGSQTRLILALLDTKVSVFWNPTKYHPNKNEHVWLNAKL